MSEVSMPTRKTIAVLLVLFVNASAAVSGQRPGNPAPVTDVRKSDKACEQGDLHPVDLPIDARLWVEAFHIDEIRKEFPIKAGMSISAVEAVTEQQHSLANETDVEDTYNLGWEKRSISDGNGWIYFWVNGKHLLHCDLVIEKNCVKSVWVMPGNDEWLAFIYYRLSGNGQHKIEGRTATDPSRVETDEQLTTIRTPSDIDRLWLHSPRVTDEGMKHLPAFTNLRKLDFNYPGIADAGLRHLQNLKSLRELNFGTVAVTDRGLAPIAALKGLECLRFWANKDITDDGLRQLTTLENLKRLHLDGTSITDRGLGHLARFTKLRELSLADCNKITDRAVEDLSRLKELQGLNLLNSGVTGTAAEQLRKRLPRCRVIGP